MVYDYGDESVTMWQFAEGSKQAHIDSLDLGPPDFISVLF